MKSMTFSRRQVIGTVALGGAALVASRAAAETSAAPASSELPNGPQWQRCTIGEATITIFSDGLNVMDGPQPMFASEQPAEDVAAFMLENYLPTNKVALAFNVVLIEIGGERILFDSGLGEVGNAWGLGTMLGAFASAGYKAEDVSVVVLTHCHADHIGGLMTNGAPTFPNARYFLGRAEYDYWLSEAAKSGPRPENVELVAKYVTPNAATATFLNDGDEFLPGIVAKAAFGHSPGHLTYEITSGGQEFAIIGDVALHHALAFQRPNWTAGFDDDHVQAAETRRRVLTDLAARRTPFFAYHLPLPGLGYVEAKGDGFEFVPMTYQLRV